MTLTNRADKILAARPLPDNAKNQLDALIEQATGPEQEVLTEYYEALYAMASPEQLALWDPEPISGSEPEYD